MAATSWLLRTRREGENKIVTRDKTRGNYPALTQQRKPASCCGATSGIANHRATHVHEISHRSVGTTQKREGYLYTCCKRWQLRYKATPEKRSQQKITDYCVAEAKMSKLAVRDSKTQHRSHPCRHHFGLYLRTSTLRPIQRSSAI